MIHPSCYVQCEEVRRLFSNEGNFIHYLFKRVEKEAAEEDTANPAVRDSVVLKGLQRLLAQSGAVSLYELMNAERTEIPLQSYGAATGKNCRPLACFLLAESTVYHNPLNNSRGIAPISVTSPVVMFTLFMYRSEVIWPS